MTVESLWEQRGSMMVRLGRTTGVSPHGYAEVRVKLRGWPAQQSIPGVRLRPDFLIFFGALSRWFDLDEAKSQSAPQVQS